MVTEDDGNVYSNAELTRRVRDLERNKVDRETILPMRSIVYGMVGIIMIAALGAVLALIIPAHPTSTPRVEEGLHRP